MSSFLSFSDHEASVLTGLEMTGCVPYLSYEK